MKPFVVRSTHLLGDVLWWKLRLVTPVLGVWWDPDVVNKKTREAMLKQIPQWL